MIVNSETYLKKQKSFQIKLDTNLKNGQKGPKKQFVNQIDKKT